MDDAAAWALEERFWTGGAAHYAAALDPACVMAFPAPAGILAGPQIAASLAGDALLHDEYRPPVSAPLRVRQQDQDPQGFREAQNPTVSANRRTAAR